MDLTGKWHSNSRVVDRVREIISKPFVDYGYRKTANALGNIGYYIKHKKVYRLMREHNLMRGNRIRSGIKRNRVTSRLITPEGPFEFFEMDIKELWIRRHR